MGLHTTIPDTRTNLCSFAIFFFKDLVVMKKRQPRSTGQLKNCRPFKYDWISEADLFGNIHGCFNLDKNMAKITCPVG